MNSWIKKKSVSTPFVDIHSHLIPGIDDGSQLMEDSLEMIKELDSLGYQKIITTPHIHPNYPNQPEDIMKGLSKLQNEVAEKGMKMEIEAAAEYYVDDVFFEMVKTEEPVLSFGDKYVLVESGFQGKAIFFETALFELKSRGYQPVLAHPERYRFLEGSLDWLVELKKMDILFQVTIGSLSGYYGSGAKKLGQQLIRNDMVDFLGSDLHHFSQINYLREGLKTKEVEKLCGSTALRNQQLI